MSVFKFGPEAQPSVDPSNPMPAPESTMNDRNLPGGPPPTAKELLFDLKNLLRDAEELAASSLTDRSIEAAEAMRVRIDAARKRLGEMYSVARDKTVAGAKCTDAAIRSHPYRALAIAVLVGVIGGALLRRSRGGKG